MAIPRLLQPTSGIPAAHLRDSLGRWLGQEKIFRDLDTLKPGQNFDAAINEAISATTVCLVLIGERWLTLEKADGTRRIEDRADWVRLEIEAALKKGVEMIPILLDGARMPSRVPTGFADPR